MDTQEVDFDHPLQSGAAQGKKTTLHITVKGFMLSHITALQQMHMINYEGSRVIDAYICRNGTDEANKLLI